MYHKSALVAVFPEKNPERPKLLMSPLWYSLLYSGEYLGIGSRSKKFDVREPELSCDVDFELLLLDVGFELLRELGFEFLIN